MPFSNRPARVRSWLRGSVAVLLFPTLICACEHSAPLASGLATSAPTHALSSTPSTVVGPQSAAPSAGAVPSVSASASPTVAPSSGDALHDAPAMLDGSGKPLGQTEDKPSVDSAAFKARVGLLWSAIVTGDPAVAEPAFFPVLAYEQVKDIEHAAGDWKSRLLRNFGRDVREYHKKLGAEPTALRLVGIEIDDPRVKWMGRGKEGNKLGYFRVTRSKLRYADPSGKEHTLEVTSLISWRGEWFVVHLHGFK